MAFDRTIIGDAVDDDGAARDFAFAINEWDAAGGALRARCCLAETILAGPTNCR